MDPSVSPARRARRPLLVAVHVLLAMLLWRQITNAGVDYARTSGFGRYFTIVTRAGTPYRDFGVEYPPLALALFRALGRGTFDDFVRGMLLVNIAAQAAITWCCFKGWGARAGWTYLLLSVWMVPILYGRYDLVAIAIATFGAFTLTRRRPTTAGIAWTVASFVKLWPAVLVPGLAARRNMRAFVASALTGLAGVAAWVIWGGTGAPGQVLTYRGARGWEFESVPGSLLRLVTRHPLRLESGAWRLGAPPAFFAVVLALAVLLAIGATWWHVFRHTRPDDGVAEIVVITSVLVAGTLLSPQFIGWVLPWVAIAAAAGKVRIERWAAAVVGFTFLGWVAFDVNDAGRLLTELATVARNVALVGLLVVAVAELRRPAAEPAAERADQTVARDRDNGAWSAVPRPAASPTPPAPTSSSTPRDG